MSSYCSPNFACTCRRHMFVAKDRAQPTVGRAAPEAVTLSLQSCARAGATPIPPPITINDADNATAHANILAITTPISLGRNTQRHYSRSHLAQSASRTVATGVSQIILSLELNILRRSHRVQRRLGATITARQADESNRCRGDNGRATPLDPRHTSVTLPGIDQLSNSSRYRGIQSLTGDHQLRCDYLARTQSDRTTLSPFRCD